MWNAIRFGPVQLALAFAALLTGTNQGLTASALFSGSSRDAEFRRQIVGTWEDDYQGRRTMTVRPDGTATMVVQLHGWKAALYASRLEFQMTWSIEDGQFKKKTTGGEPAGKVKTILKMMGDHTEERILELTTHRLRLLDRNGKRQYDWRPVQPKA